MTNPQSVTQECLACADLGLWEGRRLVRPFVAPVDLGHDGEAHRIYNMLWYGNRVRSAAELAALSDAELLKLDGLGAKMFRRIREKVPAPTVGAARLSCGPTPNGLVCLCGQNVGHAKEAGDA